MHEVTAIQLIFRALRMNISFSNRANPQMCFRFQIRISFSDSCNTSPLWKGNVVKSKGSDEIPIVNVYMFSAEQKRNFFQKLIFNE